MRRTHSQMHHTDKYSQHSSIICASLTKWLSVCLRTKWLWVRIPLQSFKGLHKTFWGTTKKCENKKLSLFLFSEMHGTRRVNLFLLNVFFWSPWKRQRTSQIFFWGSKRNTAKKYVKGVVGTAWKFQTISYEA